MKAKKIYSLSGLAIAMIFSLSSCTKETQETIAPEQIPATMELKFAGMGNNAAAATRGAFDPITTTSDEDCDIWDMAVFIFRAGGGLDCPMQYISSNLVSGVGTPLNDGTSSMTYTFPCTTAASKVYVVCNAETQVPASNSTGSGPMVYPSVDPFAGVSTESQLKAVAVRAINAANPSGTIIYTNYRWHVLMSGNAPVVLAGTNPDGTNHYSATVTEQFIPAKVNVTLGNQMTLTGGPEGTNNQINTMPLGVAVVNAALWTRLVSDAGSAQGFQPARSNISGPFFVNGIDMTPYAAGTTPFTPGTGDPKSAGGGVITNIPYADEPMYNSQPDYYQCADGILRDLNWIYGFYGNDWYYLRYMSRVANTAFVSSAYNGIPTGTSWSWNNTQSELLMAHDALYVYPGSWTSPTPKTYLVVFGKYDPTGWQNAGRPNVFWSMPFDSNDLPPLQSGWMYNVNITLKGNANFKGGGTDDPTVPPDMAQVQITATAKAWTVVNQNLPLN